jgi:hypothetical protein
LSAASKLIEQVEESGGRFAVDGDRLWIGPSRTARPLLEQVALHKMEIIGLLDRRSNPQPKDLIAHVSLPEAAQGVERDPYGLGLWLMARYEEGPVCIADVRRLLIDFCLWRKAVDLPFPTPRGFGLLQEAGYVVEGNTAYGSPLFIDSIASPEPVAGHDEGAS